MKELPKSITAYRRYWLPELTILAVVSLVTIVLFAATDLDLATVRPYYHPEAENYWPTASHPLWSLFYRSAPWVTASLFIMGAALVIAGSVRRRSKRLRLYGLFIVLCVLLGPGLFINVIFKDHYGRPRPRQLVEFGGRLNYVRPLVFARTPGESFPCGHCSVGFLYATGWWIWRRRRPRLAAASLAAGLAVGAALGVVRMAAGGHFLSDVVWSALMAYGIAHCLYYYVLRIPAQEDVRDEKSNPPG
jgi:lipid A 4'-phosphatase